jgi:hypothetical protein
VRALVKSRALARLGLFGNILVYVVFDGGLHDVLLGRFALRHALGVVLIQRALPGTPSAPIIASALPLASKTCHQSPSKQASNRSRACERAEGGSEGEEGKGQRSHRVPRSREQFMHKPPRRRFEFLPSLTPSAHHAPTDGSLSLSLLLSLSLSHSTLDP